MPEQQHCQKSTKPTTDGTDCSQVEFAYPFAVGPPDLNLSQANRRKANIFVSASQNSRRLLAEKVFTSATLVRA